MSKLHQCKCGKTYRSASALRQHYNTCHSETLVLPPGSQIITLSTSNAGTVAFKSPQPALSRKVSLVGPRISPVGYRKTNGRTLLQPQATSMLAGGGFTVTLPSGSVEIALPVSLALPPPPPPLPLKGTATTALPSESTPELLGVTSELEDLAAVVSS